MNDLVTRAAALHDPAEGLAGVRELRAHLDQLEAIHVENALREGATWRNVADALGRSKQAAHRKYAEMMRDRVPRAGGARLALLLARQEATAMRRPAIGTEHVLLGLTRLDGTPCAAKLAAAGATPAATRLAVRAVAPEPTTERTNGRAGFTIPCRAALQTALELAEEPRPEHLLRVVLADPTCGARRALERLRIEAGALR